MPVGEARFPVVGAFACATFRIAIERTRVTQERESQCLVSGIPARGS